ncbi:MAG: ABC transporter ATP-binding protein [Actinobacteria bacterium]|nr:ABC transporter ATP-binding protein [Actinomycetota bacterium]
MSTDRTDRDVLEVDGLDAFYGRSHVIHGLDMRVRPGELVALLGRNGAGKTTAFGALMGIVETRGGSIRVAGEEIAGAPTYRRARRGLTLVPSGARVFANLTVEENLAIVRAAGGDEGWTADRVYEVFPKLRDLRASMAGNLSGGERQMLAVGRGLMADPKVLLFDEPSEGLAPVILQEIGRLLGRLKELGLSMVLAEQNHRFALRYADRGYLIEKGQIRHEAPAAELEGSAALQRYLGV